MEPFDCAQDKLRVIQQPARQRRQRPLPLSILFLSRLGLVELKETRRRAPQAPTLPYDEIDFNLRMRS